MRYKSLDSGPWLLHGLDGGRQQLIAVSLEPHEDPLLVKRVLQDVAGQHGIVNIKCSRLVRVKLVGWRLYFIPTEVFPEYGIRERVMRVAQDSIRRRYWKTVLVPR